MPETALQALHALRQKGVKLFIATGRAPKSTDFLKEYFDFDGMVCFNGQYCFDRDGVIYQNPLPAGAIRNAVPYMAKTISPAALKRWKKRV